jgi:hypothetical protein
MVGGGLRDHPLDGDLLPGWRVSAMIDFEYERRKDGYVRLAAPKPPPPEPPHTHKARMVPRMPTKEEVNAAVERVIRRSAQQS